MRRLYWVPVTITIVCVFSCCVYLCHHHNRHHHRTHQIVSLFTDKEEWGLTGQREQSQNVGHVSPCHTAPSIPTATPQKQPPTAQTEKLKCRKLLYSFTHTRTGRAMTHTKPWFDSWSHIPQCPYNPSVLSPIKPSCPLEALTARPTLGETTRSGTVSHRGSMLSCSTIRDTTLKKVNSFIYSFIHCLWRSMHIPLILIPSFLFFIPPIIATHEREYFTPIICLSAIEEQNKGNISR